ncbi:hypothetical protein WHZ78_12750 [Bradyrhizobium symbiodeficiens]
MIGAIADATSAGLSASAPGASAVEASHASSAMVQRMIGFPCHILVFE